MSSQCKCRICSLSVEGASAIQTACETHYVNQGEALIKEDQHQSKIFFLCEGEFVIQKELKMDHHQQVEIARLEEGSMVGEMEFLTSEAPTATVLAGKNCKVHVLEGDAFQEILNQGNKAALEIFFLIARILAHRLKKMDEKVVEILSKGEAQKPMEEFAQFRKKLLQEWDF
ncbi:MAG: hypothetical protein D6785_03070 [Planctomycetota bacterium]|nr:MAG: hypothetical protein D6785_03070 [Planctomycetota bacterium]